MKYISNMKSQKGATLTEFIAVWPLIGGLMLTGVQYTLMYNAKTNLSYASYEAARSGAIGNASPSQIEKGLLKGLLPYLSANKGISGELDNAALLQTIKATEGQFMKVEIINPTAQAFDDFNSAQLQHKLGTNHKVIPNKFTDMQNLKSSIGVGSASGVTIEEANVLKLRVTYGYEPKIPVINSLWAAAFKSLNPPRDAFESRLALANRIPIVVDVSSQMLSPAVQNDLATVNYNAGSGGGGHGENGTMGHTLPDLSGINLPEEYGGMNHEQIYEEVMANGGISGNDERSVNNRNILIAIGVLVGGTIIYDQMDNDQIDNDSIDPSIDLVGNGSGGTNVSDFNSNSCRAYTNTTPFNTEATPSPNDPKPDITPSQNY